MVTFANTILVRIGSIPPILPIRIRTDLYWFRTGYVLVKKLMIYTIGHKESYYQAYKEHGKVYKLGKYHPDKYLYGYEGGYCFKTKEDAMKRIEEAYADRGMVVFGLLADWERDTEPSKHDWWHNLLYDSEIVFDI